MNFSGLGEIAERVRRSTVLVQPGGRGAGSGVIWSADGLIVTNAHVARGERATVSLWDGREFTAQLAARDSRRDLATLRIAAQDLLPAKVRRSAELRPGELVIAVGNPFGFLGALTTGVVHGVSTLPRLGSRAWVQSDVRLAPGNSGGPLADAEGRVIGLNTMIAGRLALAVPSDEIRAFLGGETGRNWLGATVTPVRLPRASRQRIALLIVGIEAEGPAAAASLMPGDILLGDATRHFESPDDLATSLDETPSLMRLEFLRGDYVRVRKTTVQLRRRASVEGAVAA